MTGPAVPARRISLALLGALGVTLMIWQARAGQTGLGLALAAPLLTAVPGILRGKRYTNAWSTMLVAGYIGFGLMESVANPEQRLWALASLVLSLSLFVSLIGYLRVSRPLP